MTVQLFRVEWSAPPPYRAEFARKSQLLRTPPPAPPPELLPELPISLQLFSVAEEAPAPYFAELPTSVQLLRVATYTPPPPSWAEFAASMQLETIELPDSAQIPPPYCSLNRSPALLVAPLARVNPTTTAPFVK